MGRNPSGYRSPASGFKKEELIAFALGGGVRDRVRAIETELARIQRVFPGVLVSDEPIVLLAAEPRTDGKVWPLVAPTPTRRKPLRQPNTSAQQEARSRNLAKARIAKARKRKSARPTRKGTKASAFVPLWREAQSMLQTAPDHTATAEEIREALNLKPKVNITSALMDHQDVFKRVKTGVYTLTAAAKNGAEA